MPWGKGDKDGNLSVIFDRIAALGIVAGLVCIFLGYKLFGISLQPATGTMKAKIAHGVAHVGIPNTWPGIFFMGFGALVIFVALLVASMGSQGRKEAERSRRKRELKKARAIAKRKAAEKAKQI